MCHCQFLGGNRAPYPYNPSRSVKSSGLIHFYFVPEKDCNLEVGVVRGDKVKG
jgi:hypothetical protein